MAAQEPTASALTAEDAERLQALAAWEDARHEWLHAERFIRPGCDEWDERKRLSSAQNRAYNDLGSLLDRQRQAREGTLVGEAGA